MEDCLLFPGLSSSVGGQTFPRMNQRLLNKGATMPPFFSLLAERKCRLEGPTHTKGLTFKVKHINHRGGLALEPHHWSFLSARCRCAPSLASAVTGYSAVLASSAPFQSLIATVRQSNKTATHIKTGPKTCRLTKRSRPMLNATDAVLRFICHSRYWTWQTTYNKQQIQ